MNFFQPNTQGRVPFVNEILEKPEKLMASVFSTKDTPDEYNLAIGGKFGRGYILISIPVFIDIQPNDYCVVTKMIGNFNQLGCGFNGLYFKDVSVSNHKAVLKYYDPNHIRSYKLNESEWCDVAMVDKKLADSLVNFARPVVLQLINDKQLVTLHSGSADLFMIKDDQ